MQTCPTIGRLLQALTCWALTASLYGEPPQITKPSIFSDTTAFSAPPPETKEEEQEIANRWSETEWIIEKADRGSAYACAIVAENYIRGENGCEKDFQKAQPYLAYALKQPHPIALYLEARYLLDQRDKESVYQSFNTAFEGLKSGTQRFKPDPRWWFNLAALIANGIGSGKLVAEPTSSVEYLSPVSEAALLGYRPAQSKLFLADTFTNHPEIKSAAFKLARTCVQDQHWLTDKQALGSIYAILGEAHSWSGRFFRDVGYDHRRAMHYFQKGAELNNPFALFEISNVYLQGRLVVADTGIAKAYLQILAKVLDESDKDLRTGVGNQVSLRAETAKLLASLDGIPPADDVGRRAEEHLQIDDFEINSPDRVKRFGIEPNSYLRHFLTCFEKPDLHQDFLRHFDSERFWAWGQAHTTASFSAILRGFPPVTVKLPYNADLKRNNPPYIVTNIEFHHLDGGVEYLRCVVYVKTEPDGSISAVQWDLSRVPPPSRR